MSNFRILKRGFLEVRGMLMDRYSNNYFNDYKIDRDHKTLTFTNISD